MKAKARPKGEGFHDHLYDGLIQSGVIRFNQVCAIVIEEVPKVKRTKTLPSVRVTIALIQAVEKVLDDPKNWRGSLDEGVAERDIRISRKKEVITFNGSKSITDEDLQGGVTEVRLRWVPKRDGYKSYYEYVDVTFGATQIDSEIEVNLENAEPRLLAEGLTTCVFTIAERFETRRKLLTHVVLASICLIVFLPLLIFQVTAFKFTGFQGFVTNMLLSGALGSVYASLLWKVFTSIPYNIFSDEKSKTFSDANRRILWILLGALFTLPLSVMVTIFVVPIVKSWLGLSGH